MRGTWQTTGSRGSDVGLAILAAVLIGSGALTTIVHAIEVILIVTGCTIALAVVGGIALLVYRARQNPPGRPIAAPPMSRLAPAERPQLEVSHKPAIGPAREVHLHLNVSPHQLAAIVRHYTEEN